jgi:hypothetical protein
MGVPPIYTWFFGRTKLVGIAFHFGMKTMKNLSSKSSA